MKLIKPSWEILEQSSGLQDIYKQIELAGRTCYKSLDKITDDSAEGFVNRMIASKHYAMLEHGAVYLKIVGDERISNKYHLNPYSKVNLVYPEEVLPNIYSIPTHYITTNYRVLVENDWLDDLKYLCEPTVYHEKRVTVRFTSNIHFYKDITRHRRMSFAIESTRYCNYSRDKFNNELTFIQPMWIKDEELGWSNNFKEELEYTTPAINFCTSLKCAETTYLKLIEQGWQAQQAAEILPQATKADIVMTGFVSDWNYVFDLRARGTTGAPHPEVKRLMEPLMHEFIKRNYING